MTKQLFKLPLKLTGNRLLFIVIAWVFAVTVSVFLSFIFPNGIEHIGLIYSVLTALPYIALIYYEVYEVGSREAGQSRASMKSAALRCLVFQSPALSLLLLYFISLKTALSTDVMNFLLGSLYFAPFIGPRGTSDAAFVNTVQYIVFILLETGMFLVSYYLGMKNIVLMKSKGKDKGRGAMKR